MPENCAGHILRAGKARIGPKISSEMARHGRVESNWEFRSALDSAMVLDEFHAIYDRVDGVNYQKDSGQKKIGVER